MNFIYQGKNNLVGSAARRASQVLTSSFFQRHLLKNLSEEEALNIQELFAHINKSQDDVLYITTYWNPLYREKIKFKDNPQCLSINLATLKNSRRVILEQIIRYYTLMEFKKIHAEIAEVSSHDEHLASKISSLAKVYA